MNTVKHWIFGLIFPWFGTEWVALYEDGEGNLVTAMSMSVWDEDEDPVPAGVAKIKAIHWLGFGWGVKQVGDVLDYDEWKANKG